MKIPKKVKIGGLIYRVEFHKEGGTCRDKADMGVTDRANGIITISADLMQAEKEQTFFHEAMHIMNESMDHTLLSSLSQQIYAFLKDNNLI